MTLSWLHDCPSHLWQLVTDQSVLVATHADRLNGTGGPVLCMRFLYLKNQLPPTFPLSGSLMERKLMAVMLLPFREEK